MPHIVKKLAVEELVRRYQNVKNCLLINFSKVKATQFAELREYLRQHQIGINVVSNAIIKWVFIRLGISRLNDFLFGSTALIFSIPQGKSDDPVILTKTFFTWKDKNPELKTLLRIQGGYIEGKIISFEDIDNLFRMLPREEALSQLAGLFNTPLCSLAQGLRHILQKFVLLLKLYTEKLPL